MSKTQHNKQLSKQHQKRKRKKNIIPKSRANNQDPPNKREKEEEGQAIQLHNIVGFDEKGTNVSKEKSGIIVGGTNRMDF